MTAVEVIEEIERILEGTPTHGEETGAEMCEANMALDQIDSLIERWRLLGSQK